MGRHFSLIVRSEFSFCCWDIQEVQSSAIYWQVSSRNRTETTYNLLLDEESNSYGLAGQISDPDPVHRPDWINSSMDLCLPPLPPPPLRPPVLDPAPVALTTIALRSSLYVACVLEWSGWAPHVAYILEQVEQAPYYMWWTAHGPGLHSTQCLLCLVQDACYIQCLWL